MGWRLFLFVAGLACVLCIPKKTDPIRRMTFPDGIISLPARVKAQYAPLARPAKAPAIPAQPSGVFPPSIPPARVRSKASQVVQPPVRSVTSESGVSTTTQATTTLKFTKEDLEKIEVQKSMSGDGTATIRIKIPPPSGCASADGQAALNSALGPAAPQASSNSTATTAASDIAGPADPEATPGPSPQERAEQAREQLQGVADSIKPETIVPETIPETPEPPKVPEVPEAPPVPEVPPVPEAPQPPKAPEPPKMPKIPEIPQMPAALAMFLARQPAPHK